jgi:hypothetical protein
MIGNVANADNFADVGKSSGGSGLAHNPPHPLQRAFGGRLIA